MTNTWPRLSVSTDRPLDPLTPAILRRVDEAARDLGINYLIIGATARDLILFHVFNFPKKRATRDIDFAIAVSGWDEFEKVRQTLIDTGDFTPDPRLGHRLHYQTTEYPIDIIPFGGVEEHGGTLRWPPGYDQVMNVHGFHDANRSVVMIEIAPDLSVPVVALPGFVLLKLLAWLERGNSDSKDAVDFLFVLKCYGEIGQTDRLFGPDQDLLEEAGFDIELAGTLLLGRDVARLASVETRDRLLRIFQDSQLFNHLVTQLARQESQIYSEDQLATISRLFTAFADRLAVESQPT